MNKNTACAAILALTVFLPFVASAATVEELTAQVQALVAQLAALQQKANVAPVTVVPPSNTSLAQSDCPAIVRNLSRGMTGPDVVSLQRYLIGLGFLSSGSDTGFFGPLTEKAVQEWQTVHGVVSSGSPETTGWGTIGPRTREALVVACVSAPKVLSCPQALHPVVACAAQWQPVKDANGCTASYTCAASLPGPTSSTDPGVFSAIPVSGTAPLTVTFVTIITSPTSSAGGSFRIDFGDNSAETVAGCSASGVCSLDVGKHLHTYTSVGVYTARLIVTKMGTCATGVAVCAQTQTPLASVAITATPSPTTTSVPSVSTTIPAY